jgi:formate hydrogenlyase subunit 3/multisubunit Na+/H+ antiporter MnhD subunit
MTGAGAIAAVVAPLLVASALAIPPCRSVARRLAPWAALPALLAPVLGAGTAEIPWLMFGGRLGLDGIGRALLPPTAALWLVAGLAIPHLVGARRRDRFVACFLLAMSGNFLVLAALEAVTFYLGFALMSFASYGLVVHEGTGRARHAARYYLVMVVLGEVCVITGLMLLASRGSIEFAAMRASFLVAEPAGNALVLGLLLVGFGVKAGVAGLHFWLPLAHPVAPAPASAVLSGTMIKAGLVAWIRFLPVGEIALPVVGLGVAAFGLGTAYYGVLAGLPQREPKTVLAYSSVSQMGVMTVAIGGGLAFPDRWPLLQAAVLVYIVHHGLLKGSLFLGAGIAHHPLPRGTARMVAAGFVLAGLSMAGAPWTSGLVAKLGLKHALPLAGSWHDLVPGLLVLSSLLTALLLLRFLWVAWPRVGRDSNPLPARLPLAWAVLLTTALALPWWLAAAPDRVGGLAAAVNLEAAWPVALAGLLALVVRRLPRARRITARLSVPPGDLGIPLERVVAGMFASAGRLLRVGLRQRLCQLWRRFGALEAALPAAAGRAGQVEAMLATWVCTSLLLFVAALAAAWLLG